MKRLLPIAKRAEFTADQDRPPVREERRDFLKLAAASLALAGVEGCSRAPRGEIVPYAAQPAETTPGVASHYATALERDGHAVGVIVESHEGRPTKIEGNPGHSASLGGTGIREQASVLDVYDPDRIVHATDRGAVTSWEAIAAALAPAAGSKGEGVHVVLAPTSSALTASLLARVHAQFPAISVHFHAPFAPVSAWEGARLAFGEPLVADPDVGVADVILALDSDFLASGPNALRDMRRFAARRKVDDPNVTMNRLYVVEPGPTVTGANADHRVRAKRSTVAGFLAAVVAELAKLASPNGVPSLPTSTSVDARIVKAVADDLFARRANAVVLVGETQPPIAHALAHAAHAILRGVENGRFFAPVVDPASTHGLDALAAALRAGKVETLLFLGGNPIYSAFADHDLGALTRKVDKTLYLGTHDDETAAACRFVVPEAHALERWGDLRAIDGTTTIVQPLREAPAEAATVDELLAALASGFTRTSTSHDLVREHWRQERPTSFDSFWSTSLRSGLVADSAMAAKTPTFSWSNIAPLLAKLPLESTDLELAFRDDAKMHDGAQANNAWIQELPDPVTKLTWENAALMAKTTAAKLGVTTGDVVRLEVGGRSLEAPVLVVQGHAEDAVSLAFGYGRKGIARVADGAGANAFLLRTTTAAWSASGLRVTPTGKRVKLALAQEHFSIEGHADAIFLRTTIDDFRAKPDFAKRANEPKRSLYMLPNAAPRQWGMVVDLSACTGCSACVVACQSENNVAVVGKAGVAKGREMHWLRIDRSFETDDDDALPMHEPMLCQHCERAPCEYVCPTNATTHSADGLNQMAYNRCVGTRFCSNNCPWLVRRFNWFDYGQDPDAPDPRVHNPDVTVRARGVMEKCTYCVQRVREGEVRAKTEGRALRDHDVKTACEQACPAGAIVFGDIADRTTDVSKARTSPRLFGVLNELGTQAHTRYLAAVKNPNGAMP
ncbi:MAG TPA: 4Fe-4S dicluster domain-containing protein [Polyangiaceae bacterium]